MPISRIETHRRGFFGWLFLILFWLFNAAMVAWLALYWHAIGTVSEVNGIGHAGRMVGFFLGSSFILFFWTGGAIVLGLLALLCRPSRIEISEREDPV